MSLSIQRGLGTGIEDKLIAASAKSEMVRDRGISIRLNIRGGGISVMRERAI